MIGTVKGTSVWALMMSIGVLFGRVRTRIGRRRRVGIGSNMNGLWRKRWGVVTACGLLVCAARTSVLIHRCRSFRRMFAGWVMRGGSGMGSDPIRRDADQCGQCGRVGAERDGCSCVRDAFNDIVRCELADQRPLMCECRCDDKFAPHADRLCDRPATVLIAVHRFGFCRDEHSDPGEVDADGNVCRVMCQRCAQHNVQVAKLMIRKMLSQLPPGLRTQPHCPTCQRPAARADDIVEMRPL